MHRIRGLIFYEYVHTWLKVQHGLWGPYLNSCGKLTGRQRIGIWLMTVKVIVCCSLPTSCAHDSSLPTSCEHESFRTNFVQFSSFKDSFNNVYIVLCRIYHPILFMEVSQLVSKMESDSNSFKYEMTLRIYRLQFKVFYGPTCVCCARWKNRAWR